MNSKVLIAVGIFLFFIGITGALIYVNFQKSNNAKQEQVVDLNDVISRANENIPKNAPVDPSPIASSIEIDSVIVKLTDAVVNLNSDENAINTINSYTLDQNFTDNNGVLAFFELSLVPNHAETYDVASDDTNISAIIGFTPNDPENEFKQLIFIKQDQKILLKEVVDSFGPEEI